SKIRFRLRLIPGVAKLGLHEARHRVPARSVRQDKLPMVRHKIRRSERQLGALFRRLRLLMTQLGFGANRRVGRVGFGFVAGNSTAGKEIRGSVRVVRGNAVQHQSSLALDRIEAVIGPIVADLARVVDPPAVLIVFGGLCSHVTHRDQHGGHVLAQMRRIPRTWIVVPEIAFRPGRPVCWRLRVDGSQVVLVLLQWLGVAREAEVHRKEEYDAAVRIQSWYRGIRTRSLVKNLNRCAIRIQRHYRGFMGRRRIRAILIDSVKRMCLDHYNKQAAQIQKMWRGFYVRKYVFDYYSRKKYLESLVAKNEMIRSELAEQEEAMRREARKREEEETRRRLRAWAERHHYLVSTVVQPSVFNSPYRPFTLPEETLLLNTRPKTPPKVASVGHGFDPSWRQYGQNQLMVRLPSKLPPLPLKPTQDEKPTHQKFPNPHSHFPQKRTGGTGGGDASGAFLTEIYTANNFYTCTAGFRQENAAQIQKMWRGFYVRKYVFDYYSRKKYLESLVAKNEMISELKPTQDEKPTHQKFPNPHSHFPQKRTGGTGGGDASEARKREEEETRRRLRAWAERHHYLVSTVVQPSVFNSPYRPFTLPEETLLLNTRPKTPPKVASVGHGFDPSWRQYGQNQLMVRLPSKLPPLPAKPQGPFRQPEEVRAQRYREFQPSLRVATDYE
uniref:Spermatogenesis associated 17 n=1 Tax=Macrostomum lignano TaxID=282301 RepID=A0A1I8IU60_9PLAT